MHDILLSSKLSYEVQSPMVLLLNIAIVTTDQQWPLWESLEVDPDVEATPLQVGPEKNRFHRLQLEPGEITIEYRARARMAPIVDPAPKIDQIDYAALPPDVMPYLNPSRYCESDRISAYAMAEFGSMEADFDRVNAICDWIQKHIAYRSGTTSVLTTACDVLVQRAGVCRDFAHLGIAMCRALGIPARYVSGYACRLEPADFHGFFEAYLDGRWYLFDPTRLAPPAGLVRIGVGRDAADTAFATIWGSATLVDIKVRAEEASGEEELLDEPADEVAVSTA